MQVFQLYLVDNIIRLQLAGSVLLNTEDRNVYSRPLKLYKGTDNTLKLWFRNQDQKPVSIATFDPPTATEAVPDYTVLVKMFHPNSTTQVLSKPATIDLTPNGKGIASIVLTANDLSSLTLKYYDIAVILIDRLTNITAAYNDDNYGVKLGVEVFDGPIAGPIEPITLTFNPLVGPPPGMIGSDPVNITNLHTDTTTYTFQMYFDPVGFSGTVQVQGSTLASSPTETDWVLLKSIDYVDQINPDYTVVVGTYTYLRLKLFNVVSGSVTEALFSY